MKIKFIKAYRTKAGNAFTGKADADAFIETFEEGDVVDMTELRGNEKQGDASARHFINRGYAEEVKEEGKARAGVQSRPAGASSVFPGGQAPASGQPQTGHDAGETKPAGHTTGHETSGHKPATTEGKKTETRNR